MPEPQQDTNASEMGYNVQIEESKHTDSFEACEETEIQEMSCSVPCELANDSDQTMEFEIDEILEYGSRILVITTTRRIPQSLFE